MAIIKKIIFVFVISISVVFHLYALEDYPNISFYNENDYPIENDLYNEKGYDVNNDYHYDIRMLEQVSGYNRIIDTLLKSSLTLDEALIFQSITPVFFKMNKKQVDDALDLLKNKAYIKSIAFVKCTFKELPDSLNSFKSLKYIKFYECDSLESLGTFNPLIPIFELYFVGCKVKSLPVGIEQIHPFLRLLVHLPDNFGEFNLDIELSKFKDRNNLLDLAIRGKNLLSFPKSIFNLTSLQTLMFESYKVVKYPPNFNRLKNLKKLIITCWDEEVEDSARENPYFIEFYPLEYVNDDILYISSSIYSNLCSVSNNYDHYTYWDNIGFTYAPKKDSNDIRIHRLMFGESEITIEVANKEQKMYLYVSNDKCLKNKLKASILDNCRNQIIESVLLDDKVILDLKSLKGYKYYLKITLGRYAKVFHFDKR